MKTADEVKPNNAPVYTAALYPQLAEIFVRHGYALAVHGSVARDFDVIAIPWVESPSEPRAIIDELCKTFAMDYIESETNPVQKLHGRIAHTVIVGFGTCQLDLSFMPLEPLTASVQ